VSSAPSWIRTPDEAEALARELRGVAAVAIDTEADSLHHYPERLCLIQVADPAGRVYLVDSLALPDLEPFRALCADPRTIKVLHSADNDLGHLKRRFGLTFAGLDDTMLAARFLGVRELGLERLLVQYLGIQAVKSQQKTDWARRPLTEAQETYAADDVRHLIALRDRLVAEVQAIGREAWYVEECAAVAALPAPERAPDEDGYRRVRGAGRLDRQGLSVLRAVHAQREAWAVAERRPPFKVLSPETLLAVAARIPRDRAALAGIPGLPTRLAERYGDGILAAVERGLADPVIDPPRPPRRPLPAPPALLRARADALRQWRAQAAERTGLDPGVLLPQRLIDALAAAPPPDVSRLAVVPGFRHWRAEGFGPEILDALTSAKAS
jgi:ribonuclease D